MTKIIARLGAVLGFESKDFVKGVNEAQQKSKEFKKNLRETEQTIQTLQRAAAVTGLAMIAFGVTAARTADEIADLAEANETTIGKVLELKSALAATGGDANKIGQFYASFTNAIDNAAQGNDKLRDSFKALGISTKDLGFLTQTELQQKALDGLAKIEDVVRRNALAAELFGKAAKGVDFASLAENTKAVAGNFDAQAEAIKSAADAAQKIEKLFKDIQIAALAAMKPISDLVNKIPTEDKIYAITKAFEVLGVTIAIAFGQTAMTAVLKLGTAIALIGKTNPWLFALGAIGTGMVAAGIFGFDEEGKPTDKKELPDVEPSNYKGKTPVREVLQSPNEKRAEDIKKKYDQAIKSARELNEIELAEATNKNLKEIELIGLEEKKSKLSTNDYERSKLKLSLEAERLATNEKIVRLTYEAQKQFELAPAEEQTKAKELYEEKLKLIEKIKKMEMTGAEFINERRNEFLENEIQRQQSWLFGWTNALKKYTEESEKASNRGAEAFGMVMASMENALADFVQTGKLKFKEFVGDVIKQLIYMELKAQATTLFKSLFGSVMGFFGKTGSAGSIGGDLFGFPKKASGGNINSPTIVGENGAELFVPRTPGTIIPNGAWQSQMQTSSGITVNGNYIANMSAIDTQSGMQFLAKNKNTIWAAYQSANRGVPISR